MNCSDKILSILQDNDIDGHDKPGGTDKNTNHSYVDVYGELLSPFIGKNGSLLEIGVQYGGSSLLWQELLEKFKFLLINDKNQLDPIIQSKLDFKKINYYIEDAYTNKMVEHCKNLHPGGFEVIIDDGPHTIESQKRCIELFLDLLKVNGVLIIEDVQDISYIEILKQCIPSSSFFDYEVDVRDLRTKKNRYDDIVFIIKKIKKTAKNKIAIFYHLGQFGQWQRLFQEQMNSLVVSGLYDAASFIHIGINGDLELPMMLDKFKVTYNNNKILEADTLKSLWDFCQSNNDYRVMYFHTKGSTQESTNNIFNVNKWRLYLEYFNIHQWKLCIQKLHNHDIVGTEYSFVTGLINQQSGVTEWEVNPHYAGNYWWANASYINRLDPGYLYNEDKGWTRYRSEFWIGTGNPKRFCFYQTNCFDKYQDSQYVPTDYIFHEEYKEPIKIESSEMITNKKAKFVMITMFKNESKTIGRMLESCYKYIDYYVIQDNGSTDGTPQIVEDFFKDKNIPGFVYKCEEGWVGFGWNRDHLLQKCQNTDHGCDWILKMDCDETLQVDHDFDWSIFDDKNIHSFNVTAIQGTTIYQRAWIWNANLQWKFNHDTAHETIELITEGIGHDFRRFSLPKGYKHIGGHNDGESWQSPTKYISDALILEEKLIKENSFHTDLYHFWYIGKSYFDSIHTATFPLKEKHSQEMARRCIFNFKEYLNYTHNYSQTQKPARIDEMGYYAMKLIGNSYNFLKEFDKAEFYYLNAEEFCPKRNEHLFNLALCYKGQEKYKEYLDIATKLMDPSRKNPFPEYVFILDSMCYWDTSDSVKLMFEDASNLVNQKFFYRVNDNMKKKLWVVDNFYHDPDKIRDFALSIEYQEDSQWYKGARSVKQFNFVGIKESFENIMGMKLKPLDSHGMCGRFQILNAKDNLVYHTDSQAWAAMVYLTPDAPVESGTLLLKSKITGARHADDPTYEGSFDGGFYDKTKFDVVDNIGNIYNRLIIFDSKSIHAAAQYFGQNKQNGRLTHLFFFDNE